jgi:hypothetical protein
MGPSNRQGASMGSLRKAARKVAVFHLPCGTFSTSRWSLTWAMLLLGFAGLGFVGYRTKSRVDVRVV